MSVASEPRVRRAGEEAQALLQVHGAKRVGEPRPDAEPLKLGQDHEPVLPEHVDAVPPWESSATHDPDHAIVDMRKEGAGLAHYVAI